MTDSKTPKRMKGWAHLTPEQRRVIARRGGLAAHAKGTAHEWTTATAREAGRKGGISTAARRRVREEEDAQRRSEIVG